MVAGRIPLRGYDITVVPGALARVAEVVREVAPAHRYALVTDSNVAPLHAAGVASQFGADSMLTCTIPAGEQFKTRDTWTWLTDRMLESGMGRDSTVIALGGGVVCDLAGFVAATFMRGVPVVHIPTTLLAMIDASIGGKTGVDTHTGKNMVGAFHRPAAVLIDPQVLATLPLAELKSGLAEAFKHAVVADPDYFRYLALEAPGLVHGGSPGGDFSVPEHVIQESVRIKAGVVAADEREKGARKTLNFGHTVGHAIELLSGFSLRHGEAVAVGMVLETRAGELCGITEPGTADSLAGALAAAGLPTTRPVGPSALQILEVMARDKKNRHGVTEYAVPSRIGVMAGADRGYAVPLADAVMLEVLA